MSYVIACRVLLVLPFQALSSPVVRPVLRILRPTANLFLGLAADHLRSRSGLPGGEGSAQPSMNAALQYSVLLAALSGDYMG